MRSMVAYDNDHGVLEATGALLREVARLHVRAQREQVTCCGTTVAQCHVLTELGRGGPLAMTALVRRLGLDKGWISRAVAALAGEGLLSRSRDGADGRVVVVGLTRSGRKRLGGVNRTLDRQAARVLGRISRPDRAQVKRTLELVRKALRQELRLEDQQDGAFPTPNEEASACR